MSEPTKQLDNKAIRVFAIFAAGILLNLGLFFVLAIFAPLVVGMVCGYILGQKNYGTLTGFLSAIAAYALIFVVTGFAVNLLDFSGAILIMSVIGGVGGYLGAILQKRMIEASS